MRRVDRQSAPVLALDMLHWLRHGLARKYGRCDAGVVGSQTMIHNQPAALPSAGTLPAGGSPLTPAGQVLAGGADTPYYTGMSAHSEFFSAVKRFEGSPLELSLVLDQVAPGPPPAGAVLPGQLSPPLP